jgi:hypothetical protein
MFSTKDINLINVFSIEKELLIVSRLIYYQICIML